MIYPLTQVEICRHGCLDHCQSATGGITAGNEAGHYLQERNDVNSPMHQSKLPVYIDQSEASSLRSPSPLDDETAGALYDDGMRNADGMAAIGSHFLGIEKSAVPKAQAHTSQLLSSTSTPAVNDPLLSQPYMVIFMPSLLCSCDLFLSYVDGGGLS